MAALGAQHTKMHHLKRVSSQKACLNTSRKTAGGTVAFLVDENGTKVEAQIRDWG